jgi:thiamine biosynthesis lipoprotein
MGMPAIVEIVGESARAEDVAAVFDYFDDVDERFSTYKATSEISRINRGEIEKANYSTDMREVFAIAEKTKRETDGFFDIKRPALPAQAGGSLDPSGIVKSWAIKNAAELLIERGYEDFYIEIAGDIQTRGVNAAGEPWAIGIRNPLNREEIVKVIYPRGAGVATSGTAERGQHIYNPHTPGEKLGEVASITVVGPDILEADRYATAAFAMGARGIEFLEQLAGFEGYEIKINGIARLTSGFARYTISSHE